MPAKGYINVHAFVSNAQIPLKDVAVAITDNDGDAIALRLTNRDGKLEESIEIDVPDLSESQTPGSSQKPYTTVNIYARKENYEEIFVRGVQVFAQTVTLQNLELIPLSEFPESWNKTETFTIPSQNL